MIARLLLLLSVLTVPAFGAAEEPTVKIEPPQLGGSRPLERQTEAAVVRDYLLAWKSFGAAFDRDQAELLDENFVGIARERLGNTIEEQARLGLHTRYVDRSHDLQIIFYSPEGLSLQMTDTVDYDQEVTKDGKVLATKRMRAHFLVVLTPTEVRWKVRIFQSDAS